MTETDFTRSAPKAAGDKRVSELPIVTAADDGDWLVIVKGGITSRIRKSDLLR